MNQVVPQISGTPTLGETLSVSDGTWSAAPTGVTYEWERCDTALVACTAILANKSNVHYVTSQDIGKKIRARVTAFTANGSTPVISSATAAVSDVASPLVQITAACQRPLKVMPLGDSITKAADGYRAPL